MFITAVGGGVDLPFGIVYPQLRAERGSSVAT